MWLIHLWAASCSSRRVMLSLKDAQASALTKCTSDPARNGRMGSCFASAVINDVIIGERRMEAKVTYVRDRQYLDIDPRRSWKRHFVTLTCPERGVPAAVARRRSLRRDR